LITRVCAICAAIVAQTPAARAGFGSDRLIFAAASAGSEQSKGQDKAKGGDEKKKTPEEKMAARFPQHAKVGDLIGRAMLDVDDNTIGYVQQVVKTADGKVQLIFPYGKWFGSVRYGGPFNWNRRLLALPIEVVAAAGLGVMVVDMDRAALQAAPTWIAEQTQTISPAETIQIAIVRH
jgi:hypothetical protein